MGKKPKDRPLIQRLAESITAHKEKHGLKTKDLVEKSGIFGTIMNRILKQRVNPRLSTVDTIAKGLGVDPAELLK